MIETLRQAPKFVQAQSEVNANLPASRCKLATLRAALPWLHHYSLSGVWRLKQLYDLKLRTARIQQYNPNPDYKQKEAYLLHCLHQIAQNPQHFVFLFMDEVDYYCWPEVSKVWAEVAPAPEGTGVVAHLAPWLNPIEKLGRWLRQDVLKLHRVAGDWATVRQRVHDFLA